VAKANKRRTLIIIAAVVVVLIAALAAFFLISRGGVAVETAEVRTRELAVTVLASGSVTAGESRDVYAEAQGLVKSVEVKDGENVQTGDILLTLDDGALAAQLAQAKSGLAQAKSGLAQAQAAGTTASSSIAAAEASLQAAQTGLQAAKDAQASAKRLLSLSEEVLENAQAAVKALEQSGAAATNPAALLQAKGAVTQAEASVEQAKSGVAQAKSGVAQAKGGVAQAKAGVKQAKAANPNSAVKAAKSGVSAANQGVSMAQKAVDAAVITAPIDGTVLFAPSAAAMAAAAQGGSASDVPGATLEKGSAVTPGSPVFTIVNSDKLSFTVEVDEADVPKIETGQTATVTLDSFDGEEYKATVSKIATKAKTTLTGGTVFEVEMSFDAPEAQIKLGMKGDATIEIQTLPDALTVPIEALFSEGGTDYVFVMDADNTLQRTDVQAGTTTETDVELTGGVEAGKTVALAGSVQLESGMKVKVATK
jgi:multidrug efflux pump subunit AcrA (membrane-fusion protein)